MVAQITGGTSVDVNGRPFRRRRARPAIIAAVVLLAAAMATWAVALSESGPTPIPVACNQPTPASADPSAPAPATPAPEPPELAAADRDEMLDVAPAALSTFQVRVLNASSQRGAARSVSDDLTAQGFIPVADTPYADDTVYPNRDLACYAQIRFGPTGEASAAAVWLALPCAQLVVDGRTDNSVDVALGEYYEAREQSQDAQAALEALRSADPNNPQTGADPSLVQAVHSQSC
ncbi:envelope integrity protein Cei [Gordonia sp. HNM0687]|uniref:Envelope integrity protein Cei n=1 Tax=Gordonia mangrovi TaxID=2665643 RepID=A0A6L7GTB1_9ACTN|nr:envelope integrity protein Cei [Gordonia mangrovi]MDY6812018.1 envelope integrity protein Cei [Actinomycetota bacterium]MXP22341.1 envelope integrity protein Cei [Gordonia mangrovi]UVF77767.1 envelope integrity protein Cei [Gordonia mangrovi]